MARKTNQLTPKQKVFVDQYLVDLNATQASIRAGYSKKTAEWIGPQLLGKTHVSEAIAARMQDRQKRTEITQDYVLQTIRQTVERCRQVNPVTDRKGEPVLVETEDGSIVPAFTFDAGNVLRGCELLGKHLGMFGSKVELTGLNGGPVQLNNIERIHRLTFLFEEAARRRAAEEDKTDDA